MHSALTTETIELCHADTTPAKWSTPPATPRTDLIGFGGDGVALLALVANPGIDGDRRGHLEQLDQQFTDCA
jgi:hypothetical protein